LCAQKLFNEYPSHSVQYIVWDKVAKAWGGATVIGTGTSSRTIYVYNGSVSGANSNYWDGANGNSLYLGSGIDLIVTNFGLNCPADLQESMLATHLMNLTHDHGVRGTDIVGIIQNPDFSNPDLTASRVYAQRQVFEAFG